APRPDRRPSEVRPATARSSAFEEVGPVAIQPTSRIWMDGEYVDWDQARVHVLTPSLHYGWGVFEGIRCYETAAGPAGFRLSEHMGRLFRRPKIHPMDPPVPL